MTSREPKETESIEIVRAPPLVSRSKTFNGRSGDVSCTGINSLSPFVAPVTANFTGAPVTPAVFDSSILSKAFVVLARPFEPIRPGITR